MPIQLFSGILVCSGPNVKFEPLAAGHLLFAVIIEQEGKQKHAESWRVDSAKVARVASIPEIKQARECL